MNIKLLVIIPAFNAEKFIEESLFSVIKQKIEKQIVVIDDASTDNTALIASRFKDVFLLRNKRNKGTYYSINRGLLHFSKDPSWTHYVLQGADDVWLEGRIDLPFSVFEKKVESVGVGVWHRRVNFFTKETIHINSWSSESTMIFKRKVFEKIGYWDTNRAACDTEYTERIKLAFPNRTFCVEKVLIDSYIHGENLSLRIPIRGAERLQYVKDFKNRHAEMSKTKKFYNSFTPEE
jgi:glycosyltransferase involved in cell wall biosynthesis